MLRYLMCAVAVALLALSCGSDNKGNVGETLDHGAYQLMATGDHEFLLIGEIIESSWDLGTGGIYLGADELTDKAIGTLTMSIAGINGQSTALIIQAILTKSDVRSGTAEQTNSRRYTLVSGNVTNVEANGQYIQGMIQMEMKRVLLHAEDLPENITVTGTFSAINN